MVKTRLEYLMQRKKESRYDLYETVASRQRIILSKIIDLLVFFGGVTNIIIFGLHNDFSLFGYIGLSLALFIFVYYIIIIFFKGSTIGCFLVGIQIVNIRTKNQVTQKEYKEYILKNITSDLQPAKVLDKYYNFDNRLSQNKPMRKSNFMAVNKRKYKAFLQEYRETIRAIDELEKQELDIAESTI